MGVRQLRLVLLCEPHLLGESLENILNSLQEIDYLGSWPPDTLVMARLSTYTPDILLIGDEEKRGAQTNHLIAQILERFPNLLIIRVTLESNLLQVYTSQVLPARTTSLVDVIRKLPLHQIITAEERVLPQDKEMPDANSISA